MYNIVLMKNNWDSAGVAKQFVTSHTMRPANLHADRKIGLAMNRFLVGDSALITASPSIKETRSL